MQNTSRIIPAVKGLVRHNHRALILRRGLTSPTSPGTWEFPGGHIEFGEPPIQSLLREVREETGLEVDILHIMYAESYMPTPDRQFIVISYLCAAHTSNVTLSFEHCDYLWANKAQMLELLHPKIIQNLQSNQVFAQPDIDLE